MDLISSGTTSPPSAMRASTLPVMRILRQKAQVLVEQHRSKLVVRDKLGHVRPSVNQAVAVPRMLHRVLGRIRRPRHALPSRMRYLKLAYRCARGCSTAAFCDWTARLYTK